MSLKLWFRWNRQCITPKPQREANFPKKKGKISRWPFWGRRDSRHPCFCANGKLDSSLDEILKSDPLRIKSFHSVLKLLKCFEKRQIKFSFVHQDHNSQLQSITNATAVSVVLVKHHNARSASKCIIHRWYSLKSQLRSMIYPTVSSSHWKQIIQRWYSIKSQLCNALRPFTLLSTINTK